MPDPVANLLRAHGVEEIRSYQSNLSYVAWVLANGWAPSVDDPEIQKHLAALRQYLAGLGRPEEDLFLLQIGLTVPGTLRSIVPPCMVLQENRGGFSTRRQREAAGQIQRLREALARGWPFASELPNDTEQALLKLADLVQHAAKPSDADWLRWFGQLTVEQAESLSWHALELFDRSEELQGTATAILQRLACFREWPLPKEIGLALIDRGILWPASLYRDADPDVAARLIAKIESADEAFSLNHLLLALAWTRSPQAVAAMGRWTDQPPPRAAELFAPIADYPLAAGWSLEGGHRCELTAPRGYRLIFSTKARATGDREVACRTGADAVCPGCNQGLVWLFDFTRIAAECFQGAFAEAPRRVLSCLHCACFGPVFSNYRDVDAEEWLASPDSDFPCDEEPPVACVRCIDVVPSPAAATAEPFAIEDASTLGGFPMWLQDAEVPRCLECRQWMVFLAQHDNGPLGEEGIYYAFFCAGCRVAAVCYQQT